MLIIDYHCGNPNSIKNMLKKIGITCIISSNKEDIENAEKLILPGVGSYDFGVGALQSLGLTDIIKKRVMEDKIPILGICLGAQLLGISSEEGSLNGLSLIDLKVVKFKKDKFNQNLKIPHMGWNYINIKKASSLVNNTDEETRYYFVHSFHFEPNNSNDILTTSFYGYDFVSSFEHENIFGVQFHPEKSHKYGMHLLKNFSDL